MKKNIIILTFLALALFVYFLSARIGEPKWALVDFINKYFVMENGAVLIQSRDADTVLSESCGLYLLACARLNDKARFDKTLGFIKKELISEKGVLYWKINIKTGQKERSSASIDDLRVARALIEAHKIWKQEDYLKDALGLASAIMENETSEGYVLDSFSWEDKATKSGTVNISYLDLPTIKLLCEYDPRWEPIYQRCRALMLDSVRNNGLFWEEYDLGAKKFYYKEGNVINQAYSALHLGQAGVVASDMKFVEFLRKQLLKNGSVFIIYDENGRALDRRESAAVYALCARLFRDLRDKKNENICYEKMLSFQERIRYNKYRGGFGRFAPAAKRNYNSFDSLEALLTITGE